MKGVILRVGSGQDIEIQEASSGVLVEGRDLVLSCEEYPGAPGSFLLYPPREYHFKATPKEASSTAFSFRVYLYENRVGIFLLNHWTKILFDPQVREPWSRWDLLGRDGGVE